MEPEEGPGQSPRAGSGWAGGRAGCRRDGQPGLHTAWACSCPSSPMPPALGCGVWRGGGWGGQPCLGRLGAIPFPADSDCAVERRWGRAGPVPRAKVGCLGVGKGGRACPQEKARQLSWHLRPGQPVQPPVRQKHSTRLHPRTCWPRLLPLPGMPFPFHSSCSTRLKHHLLCEALPDLHCGICLHAASRALPSGYHSQCSPCPAVTICSLAE